MKTSSFASAGFSVSLSRICAIAAIAINLAPISVIAAGGDLYVAAGFRTMGDQERIIRFAPDASGTTFVMGGRPYGLAFDRAGNLFYSDQTSIIKATPDGTKVMFASGLSRPLGIAFDATGNLFVTDFVDNAIYKFTPDATRSTFASGLNGPNALAFDQAGNLFQSDSNSGTIFKFTPEGQRSTFATGLNMPQALAFDTAGNLFVAEFGPNVLKFTPDGTRSVFVTGFTRAFGLTFAANGDLFVSDNAGGMIARIKPNGSDFFFTENTQSPRHLAVEPGGARPLNISTRMRVQTDDNVLIGGFIATGTVSKRLIVRAIGPSLAERGISGFLSDPKLELRDRDGMLIASNDNWRMNDQTQQSQEAEIMATTVPPSRDLESALIATLLPGQGYTAIVRGVNGATGVGLVEAYDLEPAVDSKLANISTRGLVEANDNVMIGGFILGGTSGGAGRVMVRAIGPSLTQSGINNALTDPTLQLRDAQGALIASNDNWRINSQSGQSQEAAVIGTTLQPTNDLESAIVITLPAGAYTAIVSGKSGETGVGLVEVYAL